MRIAVETATDDGTAETFWAVYHEAFAPLATRAAARQVLHRSEFLDEMRDERVLKYVAYDDAEQPVGMATLTSSLETVPWISPAYFEARWPEHYAQGRLYYVGFILVSPKAQRRGLYARLLGEIVRKLSDEKAVAGYDACAYNDEVAGLTRATARLVQARADAEFVALDVQTYYGFVFS